MKKVDSFLPWYQNWYRVILTSALCVMNHPRTSMQTSITSPHQLRDVLMRSREFDTVRIWNLHDVISSVCCLTTCLRFFSVGVSSSTISSIPASLRNTSLRSSSKFGVGGLREPKERPIQFTVSKLEYQTGGQASVSCM